MDKKELLQLEKMLVNYNLTELILGKGDFKRDLTYNHYLAIHRYLFESLYPFAGKLREEFTNKTNEDLYYNIYWTEVENTFETDNFWTMITSTNNGYKVNWKTAPKQNGLEASRIKISPQSKQEYTASFTLHGTGEEQNIDQGKVFKGRLLIELIKDNK